ncbi:hypothetical protein AAC387_Pa12g1762 [Persea americana]
MAESNSQGQKQGQGRNEAMETVAPQAPVTLERKVLEDLDEKLPKPCFRLIGFNFTSFFILIVLTNGFLSHPTLTGWIPSPFFPIYVHNIHKSKHGSDTGTYDTEGRFVPSNIENIFSKYALTEPDKLTFTEVWQMTKGNRNAMDFFGVSASKLEWVVLYILARGERGFLTKEAVRRVYDGTLFEFIAKQRASLIR